jgi:Sec-independent protein translocase protein TatA
VTIALLTGAAKAVGAVASAVSAWMGFKQQQSEVQAGVDKQVAADQTKASSVTKAEADAAVNASPAQDAMDKGQF